MKIKDLIAELESALHAKGNVEVIIVHTPDNDGYYSDIELTEPTPWDMNEMTWQDVATTTEPSDYLLIY